MGGSIEEKDKFGEYGPKHMMKNKVAGPNSTIYIDWDDEEHRRCVVACLVKGTCVMENDRTQCRNDREALAPAWWESFGFTRDRKFVNDDNKYDKFTYGAIFKLIRPSQRHPSSPQYVVAFRGTMLQHPKAMEDLVQDFFVVFNAVSHFTRFKRTHSDVDSLLRDLGNDRSGPVWLAGHSLGASMALEIGRNMMLEPTLQLNVRTFLFNPPHVSPAPLINWCLAGKHKNRLHTVSYGLKFGLANVLFWQRKHTKRVFQKLAEWEPELYVNPDDCICRGYIDYFVQRQRLFREHPRFASTGGRTSYRDLFFSIFSSKKVQPHLLPSAKLWTSSSKEGAHALSQWWMPDRDLELRSTVYNYPLKDHASSR